MGFALSRDLCYLSFFVAAAEFRLGSLRGRRLKGKGKGVLGGEKRERCPSSSRDPRISLVPQTPFPFPFKRLPRRLRLGFGRC